MSHQDKRAESTHYNSVYLMVALQWMLSRVRWNAQFRKGCQWTPQRLVSTALLCAWSPEGNLTECFCCAQRLLSHLQADQPKNHTFYQAFMELLRRWTTALTDTPHDALRTRMQALEHGWMMHGFVVFAVEGSRLAVGL